MFQYSCTFKRQVLLKRKLNKENLLYGTSQVSVKKKERRLVAHFRRRGRVWNMEHYISVDRYRGNWISLLPLLFLTIKVIFFSNNDGLRQNIQVHLNCKNVLLPSFVASFFNEKYCNCRLALQRRLTFFWTCVRFFTIIAYNCCIQ